MSEKSKPLTVEEVTEASDIFFPLFDVVLSRMPEGSSTEDTLHVMESIAKLAHKRRADKKEEKVKEKFGFNKDDKTEETEVQS